MNSKKREKTFYKNNRRRRYCFTAVSILFSMMISVLVPLTFSPDNRIEAASIYSLTKQQEEIAKQLEAIKKEKEALENQSEKLVGDLSWLNSKTAEERAKYEALVEEKNAAYVEMETSLAELKTAEDNVVAKQTQYKKRLQVMFENRNKGTLEMLFEATDMQGFLANAQLIAIIAESDKEMLNELIAAKDEAYLKRVAAEKYCAEMQTFVDQKNIEIEALKNNIEQTQEQIQATKDELEKAKADEAALEKESNEIATAIKSLQSSGGYYGGDDGLADSGYFSINPANAFGMRLHPIYHYWKMHSGVDINAPFDSKIVAVAEGKVIVASKISGYNPETGNNYGGSGYGNYIIIDHGGGVSSVYGHCKLLKVNVGDEVKAGQWIAVTGSTGLSTGAHLHFEIREDGSPVNPIQSKYLGTK